MSQRLAFFFVALFLIACGDSTLIPVTPPDADVKTDGSAVTPDAAAPDAAAPDAAAPDAAAPDAPRPATYPRLLVANQTTDGLRIWDNVDTLMADTAPDVMVTGVNDITRLATRGTDLVAGGINASYPLYIVRNIDAVAAGARYDDRISAATTGGALVAVEDLQIDTTGDLWFAGAEIRKLTNGLNLGSAATMLATFVHPFGQLSSVLFDEAGNKLLGGQISDAGLLVWNDPNRSSGGPRMADYTLVAGPACSQLLINEGRLYAACERDGLLIWNSIANITESKDPDVTLEVGTGEPIAYLEIRHDRLVATDRSGEVSIWRNPGAIAANRAPDQTINPLKICKRDEIDVGPATIDASNNVYMSARDGSGVVLRIADSLTTPMCAAVLSMGVENPQDLLLLE